MSNLKQFTAVIEKCIETGLYVGYVPGVLGAHSQGATLDELNANLKEVLGMLLEDGFKAESELINIQLVSHCNTYGHNTRQTDIKPTL